MAESGANEEAGFLHMLPLSVSDSMTCTGVQTALLPWGSPGHLAVLGHAPHDTTAAMMAVNYEWPTPWFRTTELLATFDLEWMHVQRYRADYSLALGPHPFWNICKGADPPDVEADSSDGRIGIECTRFAIPSRQHAHGLFRALKQRVLATPPECFAALGGNVVYVWFNVGGSPGLALPFGRPEEEATQALVLALAEHRPTPERLLARGGVMPDPAPPLPLAKTDDGAIFYCIPMTNAAPDTVQFNIAGFELGLAYVSMHEAAHEWMTLWDRVRRKDRSGTDWLLISVGAPDRRGMVYPSEEALAEFMLAHPAELSVLGHLKRVTMHFWSTGTAVDIWPERRQIFGPLFQGMAPAHRPFRLPAS